MSESATQKEPYTLRGHHFKTVLESWGGDYAADVMNEERAANEAYLDRPNSKAVDLSILDSYDPANFNTLPFRRAYARDLLGDTEAEADAFERNSTMYLRRFHELESDDPVVVGVGILDGICKSCTFQRHCRNTKEKAIKHDYDALKVIYEAAQYLNLATNAVVTGTEGDIGSYKLTTTGAVMHGVADLFLDINEQNPAGYFDLVASHPQFTFADLVRSMPKPE